VPRKSDLTGIGELLSRGDAAGTYRISDGVLGINTSPPVYVQPSTATAQVGRCISVFWSTANRR